MRALEALVEKHQLRQEFSDAVHDEVSSLVASPGFDDPTLTDRRALPFITIDNEDSRDLDQALCIQAVATGGYVVFYALADASFYVRPGSALFAEAVRRAASYYLPGFSVPMLPRALCEDIVSLNEDVDRRALVMTIRLDAQGHIQGTAFERSLIRSRRKLSYPGVQRYLDGDDASLSGHDFTETLDLLAAVGTLRIEEAATRDVVRFEREYVQIGFADETRSRFRLRKLRRNDVEKYNEQISLMCNSEGAQLLREAAQEPYVQAIFRVHDAPAPHRVSGLVTDIDELVEAHGLPAQPWRWRRDQGQSLAAYLRQLPREGEHHRLAKAIQRQALVINERSTFSVEAGRHHGVGADEYSRFSAPMREVVGIFTHKEALERLAGCGAAQGDEHDESLRSRIVDVANAAKTRQKRLSKDCYALVLDQMFSADLEHAMERRPVHRGTVMGRSSRRAYVELDDSSLDVKVYSDALQSGLRIGDPIDLRVDRYDEQRRRWYFRVQ